MDRDIHTTTLGSRLGGWTVNVVGAEISKHSDVRCLSAPGRGGASSWPVAKASEEDHERWHGAADRLLATIRTLQAKESAASLHLRPPFRGRFLWYLRYARRNQLLRRDYDRVAAELRAEFAAAMTEYLEQAGDLLDYVMRYQREERERRRLEAEETKLHRARAMETDTGPHWAYKINAYGRRRSFWIYLGTLDTPEGRTGLTPEQVQAALTAERAEHPYTSVMWASQTRLALVEKYQTEASGWARLTGEVIIAHPHDPSEPRPYSKYHGGPSSNYGSDGGASGHTGAIGGSF